MFIMEQVNKPVVVAAAYSVIFDFREPLWSEVPTVAVWRRGVSREYRLIDREFERLCDLLHGMPGACTSVHPLGVVIGFPRKEG